MMKHYTLLSAALAAVALLGSVTANGAEQTFADSDAVRAKELAVPAVKPAPLSAEQAAYSREFDKQVIAARKQIETGAYAAGETALNTLLADTKAPDQLRFRVVTTLADSAWRQKKHDDLIARVDGYLKDLAFLTSSDRAWLLDMKAKALNEQKKYRACADVHLLRLNEAITEPEAFRTKQVIISALESAGDRAGAIRFCKELADNAKGDEDRATALTALLKIYQRASDEARAMETLGQLEKAQKDLNKLAYARNDMAGSLYGGGKKATQAKQIWREIIGDEQLKDGVRADVFIRFAMAVRETSRSDKSEILKVADETILKRDKFQPDQYSRVALFAADIALNYLGNDAAAEKYAAAVLAYPGMPDRCKIDAIGILSHAASKNGDFAKAEQTVLRAFEFEKLPPQLHANICQQYAKILAWQERCDDAVTFLRSKMTDDTKALLYPLIADTYMYFYRWDDAAAAWREAGNPAKEMDTYAQRYPEKAKALAKKALEDEKQPEDVRAYALGYFLGSTPEDRALRAKYASLLKRVDYRKVTESMKRGAAGNDTAHVQEMYDICRLSANHSLDSDCAWMLMQVYAVTGAFDKAVELAADPAIASDSSASKVELADRPVIIFCAKMLKEVADKPGSFKKFYEAYKFPAGMTKKEISNTLLKASSLAINAKKFAVGKEAHAAYDSLFKPEPKKTYAVKFTDAPVRNMNGFLALKNEPERQIMDRKYGGNMEFLTTDVATGDRGTAIGPGENFLAEAISGAKVTKDEVYVPTDMQVVCDEYGLHFMFTSHDSKAREIESGLVSGGAYEMYVSPGENQPHLCYLPDMNTGLNSFLWNGSYKTAQWRGAEPGVKRIDVRDEHMFMDNGYRHYMYLSWERFYDKLPERGDCWLFENIHWSRFGGTSWNGTKSIHGRSTWGNLVFDISDSQMAKIKRHIVFAARKAYLEEKVTNGQHHGSIDRMQNDTHAGDPVFFAERAKPLIDKLDSYLPMVKPDMDDATVNTIFHEAVPGWFEISFMLADLHRRYLEERLSE